MKISQSDAERLEDIAREMGELASQFKNICRQAMRPDEYALFKERTLSHLEPALFAESDWFTSYSSIDSLENVVANALDSVQDGEDEDEEENEDGDMEDGEETDAAAEQD